MRERGGGSHTGSLNCRNIVRPHNSEQFPQEEKFEEKLTWKTRIRVHYQHFSQSYNFFQHFQEHLLSTVDWQLFSFPYIRLWMDKQWGCFTIQI